MVKKNEEEKKNRENYFPSYQVSTKETKKSKFLGSHLNKPLF